MRFDTTHSLCTVNYVHAMPVGTVHQNDQHVWHVLSNRDVISDALQASQAYRQSSGQQKLDNGNVMNLVVRPANTAVRVPDLKGACMRVCRDDIVCR